MNPTFPSTIVRDSTPLSKRRRFIPSSRPCHILNDSDCAFEDHNIDGPLLQQLIGQTPTQQEIESELLQVGMRIRKAVGDGYKTTAFTPRPFFNMHRLSPATQAALCSGTTNKQPISTATFCGVNLAALAHISSTPVGEARTWTYTTGHKRGCEVDSDSDDLEYMPSTPTLGREEDEMMNMPVDYFSIDIDSDAGVSPFTQVEEPVFSRTSGRLIAKPKSRRRPAAEQTQPESVNPFAQLYASQPMNGTRWMGHRRMTSCGIEAKMSLNDFGEANFLQRREDVDMDCS